MSFNTQNTCDLSFLSQFEEGLQPKLERTEIQLLFLQYLTTSVLEINKVVMENYAKEFHNVLLNMLLVQNKF